MAKIAICFFGITRSLTHTVSSIELNILAPARKLGEVIVYSHFFLQKDIINPRSGELGELDLDEQRLLPSDWLQLEEPDACLSDYDFDQLRSHGDSWQDDFRSLRNLVHQLHSLNAVTKAALADGADICLFCRPDLTYHDSLLRPLKLAAVTNVATVFLPYWQGNGGLNDRFAICVQKEAISAYGQRIQNAHAFCSTMAGPLNSEHLLAYSLSLAGVNICKIGNRASRTRLGGVKKYEDFSRPWVYRMKTWIRPQTILFAERLGLRQTFRALLKKTRP
jgi:hypothetical protein